MIGAGAGAGAALCAFGVLGFFIKNTMAGPSDADAMGRSYYRLVGRWWQYYLGIGALMIAVGVASR